MDKNELYRSLTKRLNDQFGGQPVTDATKRDAERVVKELTRGLFEGGILEEWIQVTVDPDDPNKLIVRERPSDHLRIAAFRPGGEREVAIWKLEDGVYKMHAMGGVMHLCPDDSITRVVRSLTYGSVEVEAAKTNVGISFDDGPVIGLAPISKGIGLARAMFCAERMYLIMVTGNDERALMDHWFENFQFGASGVDGLRWP